MLAAIDAQGLARRVVRGEGMRSVEGASIPGVYVEKDFGYVEGAFGVLVGGAASTSSTLLSEVVPAFVTREDGLTVRRILSIEQWAGGEPALRCTVVVDNSSDRDRDVSLALIGDATKGSLGAAWMDGVAESQRTLSVPAGRLAVCAAEFAFEYQPENVSTPDAESLLEAVDRRIRCLSDRYGDLRIEGGGWFADFLVRSAELARQSSLHAADGSSIGSFWGSNATPIPDVWTRDLFYTAMSSAQFDLDDAIGTIDFLARTALPRAPWGKENEVDPRDDGLSHSLGNAASAVALAGLTAETFGADEVFTRARHLRDHGDELAWVLLGQRPAPGELYPSHYISDGPSRGDFHTGSNVLAWYALTVLARYAERFGIDESRARDLSAVAADLRESLDRRCVVDEGTGRSFVEGVNRDGSVVAGHDGEESDLTLASSYGFAGRFDPRVVRHAQQAFTAANPYYDEGAGGVTFWDWDDYNGVTFPAYIHKLASASSEADLLSPLEDIRRLTDLDGSLWWWPLSHRNPDSSHVKRGLGKCGWCAGAFVQRFVHDIFGVRRHADSKSVVFSPAMPWRSARWDRLPFLTGSIDVAYDTIEHHVQTRLRNNAESTLTVTLEAPVPVGCVVEDIRVNGENGRYQSAILDEFGRVVVRAVEDIEPGQDLVLDVRVSAVRN
ncbi:hypothetical protein [Microbacterium sp. MMO-32]|uniref:hypothetical protein n=1 Tax=Microbacterium sp. MMO-32 TaxID=3081279 RepID=UPI0030184EDA